MSPNKVAKRALFGDKLKSLTVYIIGGKEKIVNLSTGKRLIAMEIIGLLLGIDVLMLKSVTEQAVAVISKHRGMFITLAVCAAISFTIIQKD